MNKTSIQKLHILLKQNKYLINIIVVLIGIICTFLGVIIQETSTQQFFFNIGISFISTGIVTILTIFVISDDDEQDALYTKWGMIQIYRTRSEMNSHTATVFPIMKNEYCQIAFGVKSLRDAYDKLFEQKVKKGLKIRFITIHPNSIFLRERERVENKQSGEIRKTILDLISWIEKLQRLAKNPTDIQIKFYDSLPLDFYCKIDNNLYIGPYLYNKESQQTISYRFLPGGLGFEYYTDYFDDLWNSSIMKDLAQVRLDLSKAKQNVPPTS